MIFETNNIWTARNVKVVFAKPLSVCTLLVYLHLDSCESIIVIYQIRFSFPRTRLNCKTGGGIFSMTSQVKITLNEITRSM